MPDVSVIAVLAATTSAFVLGGAYYTLLGDQLAEVSAAGPGAGQPAPGELAVELIRCLVLCAVVAGLASQGGVDDWAGGLLLGLALWVGFPAVLWVGAMVHENTPPKLAAIHAGDWLIKLLVVGLIVSLL